MTPFQCILLCFQCFSLNVLEPDLLISAADDWDPSPPPRWWGSASVTVVQCTDKVKERDNCHNHTTTGLDLLDLQPAFRLKCCPFINLDDVCV